MNNNMSIGSYVQTFAVRTGFSLVLAIACFVGVHLAETRQSDQYHFSQKTVQFDVILYTATAVYELLAGLLYISLLWKSRYTDDLSSVNNIDRTSTCLFCVLRIGFTISLSIILIVQASGNTEHSYS